MRGVLGNPDPAADVRTPKTIDGVPWPPRKRRRKRSEPELRWQWPPLVGGVAHARLERREAPVDRMQQAWNSRK
ncbi:hypothetical protein NDU88_003981 [Pleurodeles waltl]|uniref:Uncharacterized protein n=1 Tax=Pleurodeles waltl TaxID=8319 RepID=A0AAV7TR98_PLEWA|nr:hypothetical protein NDU88_003981 [Pleurodeles waltl]